MDEPLVEESEIVPLAPLRGDSLADAKRARASRIAFAKAPLSQFVKAMHECMDSYDRARAAGMSRIDAIKGIEFVVRQVWSKPVTKFGPACLLCYDLGYEERICRPYAWCERLKCREKGEEWQHRYVVPCMCPAGDKLRPKTYTPEEAIVTAAKVSKPKKGWSKL